MDTSTDIDPSKVSWDDAIDPSAVKWDPVYDASRFQKIVGRAPSDPELKAYKDNPANFGDTEAAPPTSPVGILADRLIGGAARGIYGGWKGIFGLLGGKSGAEAAESVNQITSQSAPATTGLSKATDAALSSKLNPMNWIDASGEWMGDKSADMGVSPGVSTALRVGPDAVAALLGLRRGGAADTSTAAEPEAVQNQPHPLSAAASAETERLAGMRTEGAQRGLQLPEGGTAAEHQAAAVANRPVVTSIVQKALGLPEEAPLDHQMLDAAREHYGSPAYEAAREVPEFKLGDAYEKAISQIDLDEIKEKFRPPESGTMTGDQAVTLSRYLRDRANKYFAAAKGNPELEDRAQAHWDAAQAVEDGLRDHLREASAPVDGDSPAIAASKAAQAKIADNWDAARTYIAKTYSVENALDGAGNVNVGALKRQLLKGKPLSGDLEMLANLGARYPLAFKLTQESAPNVGVIRRAAAAVVPHLTTSGAALAGSAFGPVGAGAAALGGRVMGQKIADRIAPPQ